MRGKRAGFTLLELLVTISIIGILLAIGSVSFSTAQKKGRDSRRQGDMKAIQKSLEECFAVDISYPAAVSGGSALDCTGGEVTMNQVPTDPKNSGVYVYSYTVSADNGEYCLCAALENVGSGNANTTGGAGVCSYATTNNDYFCVSNQQ